MLFTIVEESAYYAHTLYFYASYPEKKLFLLMRQTVTIIYVCTFMN